MIQPNGIRPNRIQPNRIQPLMSRRPKRFAEPEITSAIAVWRSMLAASVNSVEKRRDVLQPFGAYPIPLLLIKAVAPADLALLNGQPVQIPYNGGAPTGPMIPGWKCSASSCWRRPLRR